MSTPSRSTTGQAPSAANVAVSIARLPATSKKLFGREADLAWLDAAWNEGANVATVVAWGGVGKSALVNRWLAARIDEGWDGAERVFGWSFYSQGTDRLSSSDEFVDAALRWFGDPDTTKGLAWDKGERLAGLVRKQKTILILDGVEPLQWGPGVQQGKLKDPALQALVKELAAQNEGICLITSRIGLTDLDGLSGDKVRARDLGNLSPEAGAELLKARGAHGADEELQAASKEFQGHGLALTLLGSYLAEVAEGDIRRRKEIGPLEEAERHGGHALRVMKSYEPVLGKAEAAIVRMLGLFDRPADDDEMAALRVNPMVPGLTDALAGMGGRDWNKAVAKLRKVGLLSAEQDKRLDAHPLVREHFGEQLRREQPEAWRQGHRRLYEHLKKTAKELPDTVDEMAPLYAAVVHGCLAGKNQEALDEVFWKRIDRVNEHFNLHKLGAFGSAVAVLSAFFDPPWERLAPGLSEPDQAWVLNSAGFALRALGRLSEAAALMRLAVDARVAQQNWEAAAIGTSNLSELLQTHGELREALEQARKSVDFADKSGDAFRRMANRTTLAAAQHAMGLRAEAAAQFEEAERMQKEMQPAYPLLYSLQGFQYCDFLLDQGRDADVRERAAQMLANIPWWYSLLSIALDHLSLGRAHLLGAQRGTGGRLALATSHLKQAVDGLRRAGAQHHLPLGLLARTALHTHKGNHAAARHDLDEALALATRCEFRLHEADTHLGYARLALAQRDPARAQSHLARARALIEETEYHRRDEELAQLEVEASQMPRPEPLPVAAAPEPPPPPPAPRPSPAKPPTTTTAKEHVDIGIVIALEEEAIAFMDLVRDYTPHDGGGMSSFLFQHADRLCAITLAGSMGETDAATATDRQITHFDPVSVLSIGISGGVHDDLRVGDVFVPRQTVQYMQDGKASPKKRGGYTIVPGSPSREVDHKLLTAATAFRLKHKEAHARWQKDGSADLTALVAKADRDRLFAADLVRRKSTIHAVGHAATGPVVAGANEFSGWILSHDRNVKAIDMESAAVVRVAKARNDPRRTLVIRGISDYGDPRKKELDAIGKGGLRRYAMHNAVRLLFALLDVEAFPKNPR